MVHNLTYEHNNNATIWKTCAFFVVSLACSNIQATETIGSNSSKDSISMFLVPTIFSGSEGVDATWYLDFPETDSHGVLCKKYTLNDSVTVCEKESGLEKYLFKKDQYLLFWEENAQIKTIYETPKTVRCTNIVYGDTIRSLFSCKGIYCGTHDIRSTGEVIMTADALGRILLEDGGIIDKVTRIHTIETSTYTMDRDFDNGVINRQKHGLVERYQWYTDNYPHPIMGTILNTSFDGEKEIGRSMASWVIPRDSLLQLAQSRSINDKHVNGNNRPQENDVKSTFDYNLRIRDRLIDIEYSLGRQATMKTIVCDIMGMVYVNSNHQLVDGSNQLLTLDCYSLKRGDYVLYINIDNNVYSNIISFK